MRMSQIRQVRTAADMEEVLASPEPVLLFKHSTACSTSARAYQHLQEYLKHPQAGIAVALVRVIEERPLSRAFADRLGVLHESPQAILIRDGRAVWHASHRAINDDTLREAAAQALSARQG